MLTVFVPYTTSCLSKLSKIRRQKYSMRCFCPYPRFIGQELAKLGSFTLCDNINKKGKYSWEMNLMVTFYVLVIFYPTN